MWFRGTCIFLFFGCVVPVNCLLNSEPGHNKNSDDLIRELKHNFTAFKLQMEATILEIQHNASGTVSELEHKLALALDVIGNQQSKIAEQNQRLNQTEEGQERRITELEHKLALALDVIAKQQHAMTEQEQRLNQTTASQQQILLELEDLVFKQNETVTNQRLTTKLLYPHDNMLCQNCSNLGKGNLQSTAIEQRINKSLSAYQIVFHDLVLSFTELDTKMNNSLSAYEVILHDVVDRHNQHVASFNNQTRLFDQKLADLGKQFHYLSLSVLSYDKKTAAMNETLYESLEIIAFTVSVSNSGTQWANKKVIYDKVLINKGNGYSAQTGVFTCPRDGEYVFTWSTMSNSDSQDCFAFIYRNGVKSLEASSYEAGGSEYEVASNTEVFHLTKGDTIWIQTDSCGYFFGYPYTAFSGWKL